MPRKSTGCWTCKARKKRCDDVRPTCSSCALRSIKCYGYDKKPEWMDGGPLEKEMMLAIKMRTKESYRQRRTKRPQARSDFSSQDMSTTSPSPLTPAALYSPPLPWSPAESSMNASHVTSGSHLRGIQSTIPQRMFSYDKDGRRSISSTDNYDEKSRRDMGTPQSTTTATSESWFPYSEQELNMVMYYLDHIFPRIYPFFKYSAADNGRGWLLNLLLRTRPICAAAICLSACDQKQFVVGALSDAPQNDDLEIRHIEIVADLRDHLGRLSEKTGAHRMAAAVEALACIMHLILFELWIPRKGIMNDWVMHLEAASALLSSVALPESERMITDSPASVNSEVAENEIARSFPIHLLSEGDKSAFEYYLSLYTWTFITSTVSLGLMPNSEQAVARIKSIFHKDQSKLRGVLGCEDWIMTTLLDIAVLKDWKQKMQSAGTLSLRELSRRADILDERLGDGIRAMAATESNARTFNEKQQRIINNTMIHGSLLFLSAVTSGFFPNLPEIRQGVANTLEALEYMRENSSINIPSWPYCVAGCLAQESQYSRIRALLPPPRKDTHPLVLTRWTLDIIEECWRVRASQADGMETCDWVTAMGRLGTRLLLA
ncbi:hypothetical protein BT63DRAFT_331157 [Microthyrium microscopicum]|uniref:Zn(2)-C6 fungal-type domain-containing protein n=1 Tax=Microthyrium microscopicum TaxID=703497 RepID=A0A6A6U7T5_9PEZI|nr:hypothetical protein BT63DRAFT_331157 [Microthyrium microscopicum]